MVVMGLELGQTFDGCTYQMLYSYVQKYLPFIMYCEICCSLQIKQTVYKHMTAELRCYTETHNQAKKHKPRLCELAHPPFVVYKQSK